MGWIDLPANYQDNIQFHPGEQELSLSVAQANFKETLKMSHSDHRSFVLRKWSFPFLLDSFFSYLYTLHSETYFLVYEE